MTVTRRSYRERIYSVYASGVQGVAGEFDPAAAEAWGAAYATYLRGWLPGDRDAAILDAACGGGRLLYFLRRQGFRHLTGVDVSPEQVALARQVTDDIVREDVLRFLASNPGRFDLVLGLDIVEHLAKDEVLEFLGGCREALKPGGRLVLQTPNGDSPWFGAVRYADFTHEVCFTPASLRIVLELCGFGGVEARECGPVPRGLRSALRTAAWQLIRLHRMTSSLVETGSGGSGVCTRVFVSSGIRGLGTGGAEEEG